MTMQAPGDRGQAAGHADLLDLACRAALAAGHLLAEHHGRPAVVATKSSPTDVVTEMDRQAERLIRQTILAQRPGDAILGEEEGQTSGTGSPAAGRPAGNVPLVRWVVDPLDGTVNYLYGMPDWAVSVAAESGGQIVAGVVCAPRRDALFGAVSGGGAWRMRLSSGTEGAREPLSCNADVPLDRALIATGFGYGAGRRLVQAQVLAEVLPRVRDIRRNGACSIDLCMLASGQVDGYYERGVQYWDIAAGGLIAREAGAVVAGLAGRPPGPEMTLAAGPALFAQLHDLLAGLDPERDA
jgi:myo-inositol-1(or 4)-monophosphatase